MLRCDWIARFITMFAGASVLIMISPSLGGNGLSTPGPDVIVGDVPGMAQFGRFHSQVGLAMGSTACNKGDVVVNWFAMPNVDHPAIAQNLFRLKNDRFEQIGQSWVKHGYGASQQNACGFGCTSSGNSQQLGVGCSDPYTALNNAEQIRFGARGWIHPFTGAFPSSASNHSGHIHNPISHLLQVEDADLDPASNSGALYFGEVQYVVPQEYRPNNGIANNQWNNVSHRRFNVTGVPGGTFTFVAQSGTVQEQPAIIAWPGAEIDLVPPGAGIDGWGYLASKVTGPVGGVWHYEYVLYNMNLDRGMSEFIVPRDADAVITSIGHHSPPQQPGELNDATGGVGFSNAPWLAQLKSQSVQWNSETYAVNPNANAIRWGTAYNFRFDANMPPRPAAVQIGMFKTSDRSTVLAPAPDADCNRNGLGDSQDIFSGSSADLNANGVPDECETVCMADIAPAGGNSVVDIDDLIVVITNWGATSGPADINDDQIVNIDDMVLVITHWGPCR